MLKSEADEAKKNGRVLADMQFTSFQYKLIPIKEYWRLFYNGFNEFRIRMSLLINEPYNQLRLQDKRNGTHLADSLAASVRRETTDISEEEVHFNAKYENADPAQKLYEVLYELTYKEAGIEVKKRRVRTAFYPSDLSEREKATFRALPSYLITVQKNVRLISIRDSRGEITSEFNKYLFGRHSPFQPRFQEGLLRTSIG